MIRKSIFQSFIETIGLASDRGGEGQEKLEQMGRVVPDARRCVQCGVCSYNCPIGIPVRDYAYQGLPIQDPGCITCGQCIQVCPRGTLRWETKAYAMIAGQRVDEADDEEPLDRLMISILAAYEG